MNLNSLIKKAHENAKNKGFWDLEQSITVKITKDHNKMFNQEEVKFILNAFKSQKIALLMTELGEAIEALRRDDIKNFEEELGDLNIRLGDTAGGYQINLARVIEEKMKVNRSRPRRHGKEF